MGLEDAQKFYNEVKSDLDAAGVNYSEESTEL
jgi:hypothetical protein